MHLNPFSMASTWPNLLTKSTTRTMVVQIGKEGGERKIKPVETVWRFDLQGFATTVDAWSGIEPTYLVPDRRVRTIGWTSSNISFHHYESDGRSTPHHLLKRGVVFTDGFKLN